VFAAINGRGDVMGSALARTLHATQVAAGVALGLGLTAAPGFADVIDPQLFVCTSCTAPAGGDPNFINVNSFNVGFAGNHTAVAPLLILVAVPDGGAAPTLSVPTGVTAATGSKYYGLHNATSGNLTGVLEGTLTSGGDAYTTAGLTTGAGGGASQSFTNYTTTPFPGGKPNPDAGVTSFGIFAYALSVALNSGSGGNSPVTGLDLTGGSLVGDFVIAYNCATAGATCTGGDIGETPFTNAGFVGPGPGPVPLPTALPLFTTGLVGLGLLARRRKKAIAA
jgi:hypothetical protein